MSGLSVRQPRSATAWRALLSRASARAGRERRAERGACCGIHTPVGDGRKPTTRGGCSGVAPSKISGVDPTLGGEPTGHREQERKRLWQRYRQWRSVPAASGLPGGRVVRSFAISLLYNCSSTSVNYALCCIVTPHSTRLHIIELHSRPLPSHCRVSLTSRHSPNCVPRTIAHHHLLPHFDAASHAEDATARLHQILDRTYHSGALLEANVGDLMAAGIVHFPTCATAGRYNPHRAAELLSGPSLAAHDRAEHRRNHGRCGIISRRRPHADGGLQLQCVVKPFSCRRRQALGNNALRVHTRGQAITR